MVKKILKGLGILLGLLVLLIAGLLVWVLTTYDKDYSSTPLPNIHASTDPEVIARGEYVANAIAHCSGCHALTGTETSPHLRSDLHDMRGGYALSAGPFGTFYPSNLTQDRETGIGALSDGQIARAIRAGVAHDGKLAAFMRLAVGNMADEDLTAVISYLRTLPPISNRVPRDEWGFIAKALSGQFIPHGDRPIHYVAPGEPSAARGEYIANGPGACLSCHTPADPADGFAPSGPRFSGAAEADVDHTDQNFEICPPNLTPDPETGIIARWDEEQFVARFRAGRVFAGSKMPWENFARMTENDLRSLYRYLHALPPTRHDVGATRRRR